MRWAVSIWHLFNVSSHDDNAWGHWGRNSIWSSFIIIYLSLNYFPSGQVNKFRWNSLVDGRCAWRGSVFSPISFRNFHLRSSAEGKKELIWTLTHRTSALHPVGCQKRARILASPSVYMNVSSRFREKARPKSYCWRTWIWTVPERSSWQSCKFVLGLWWTVIVAVVVYGPVFSCWC